MNTSTGGTARQILPLILYCGLIFFLSSLEHPPAPDFGVDWSDKIIHTIAYTVMMLAAFRATRAFAGLRSTGAAIIAAAIFTLLYGASDEFHQLFVPGRSCDIADWFADTTGAAIGALIVLATVRRTIGRFLFGAPREPRG